MCGILGFHSLKDSISYSAFKSGLDSINHRGPDDEGIVHKENLFLGHKRLSIIDLKRSASQPMIDKESGAILIFNGEIYNYVELKKDLIKNGCTFRTTSDTEVLLKALLKWNEKALAKLNGMWAFAFFNPKNNTLMVSRDRFGVKPLFFSHKNDTLIFGSESKALLALDRSLMNLNLKTLMNFFENNSLYSNQDSFYDDVSVFPPAHYGIYSLNNSKFNIYRYWEYPSYEYSDISYERAYEEFVEIFNDSVSIRLRSDVGVGIALSGGMDSSSILQSANSTLENNIISFTSTYNRNEYSESRYAKYVAKKTNSELIFSESAFENWMQTMHQITFHLDSPGYSPAVFPLWNLMNDVKKNNCKVLIEGQGADELLGGYIQYPIINFLESNKNISMLSNFLQVSLQTFTSNDLLKWFMRESFPNLFQIYRKKIGYRNYTRSQKAQFEEIAEQDNKYESRIKQRLYEDHSKNILPGLLHYGDAISMANSIESRNPFLDYRLVDWAFKMPSHIIFNDWKTKALLRTYLLENKLEEIANRKKEGYPTPVYSWIHNQFRENIIEILQQDKSVISDIVNIEKVISDLGNPKSSNSNNQFLYKLVSSILWANGRS